MNRRQFLTLGLFLPAFPKLAMSEYTEPANESMAFPVVFSEVSNQTNKVSISEFKSNNALEQLWQDILRFIK